MIPVELAEVARLTGGRLVDGARGDVRVTGPVVVDSRRTEPGGLFVSVKGEHHDGHDFAAQAVAAGAVATLAERPVGVPAVVVDDAQAALGALAAGVLAASSVRVIGVTGSSGKTSTKDLLAQVFATAGETVAPEGSFNNELGLPLTVLRITPTTRTLVLEYSARGPGHIRYLCGLARPRIGIVLNVGDAHLGEFGSRAAIAQAKGELVEALPDDGVAVLNADDPNVVTMAARTSARVVTFGAGPESDVRLDDLTLDELARPAFRLVTPAGEVDLRLRLHGRHHALNAAAVVAAALGAGLPLAAVVQALEAATAHSPHRMQLRERADGVVVIDDAYNANPDSVQAAIRALTGIRSTGGRSWVVLGVMRELGPDSVTMHEQVGAFAAESGVDHVVVVGPEAGAIGDGARSVAGWRGSVHGVPDAGAAVAVLRDGLRSGDVVLVKASNAEQLWHVADALLEPAPAGTTAEVKP